MHIGAAAGLVVGGAGEGGGAVEGHCDCMYHVNTYRWDFAEVAALVARKGLSVRETEALVKRMLADKGKPADKRTRSLDPDIRRLQDDLSERLGARVAIQHGGSGRNKGSGKFVVTYNSLDELEGILSHIQ